MNVGAFRGAGHRSFCKYKSSKECLSRKCWKCYSNGSYLRWRVQKCPLGNTYTHTDRARRPGFKSQLHLFWLLQDHEQVSLSKIQFHSLLKDIIFDCLILHATEMSDTETYRFPSIPPRVVKVKLHTGNSQTVSVMGGRTQISAWQGIVNLIWN